MSDNSKLRDFFFKLMNGAKIVPEDLGIEVLNETGSALAAGDLVVPYGWDETRKMHNVVKADADEMGLPAQYVSPRAIANGASGIIHRRYRLTAQNTNAGEVGDPVYLSTTAGGWTLTAPNAPWDCQIVGFVAVKSASVGVIEFNLSDPITKRLATTSQSPSASESRSASLSPSLSASLSPSPSSSASLSPSPSSSASLSPSLSPSLSASLSPSLSESRSASLSPSPSASPSLSASLSPSVSTSLSPSLSPSPSASPSLSPSASPSA